MDVTKVDFDPPSTFAGDKLPRGLQRIHGGAAARSRLASMMPTMKNCGSFRGFREPAAGGIRNGPTLTRDNIGAPTMQPLLFAVNVNVIYGRMQRRYSVGHRNRQPDLAAGPLRPFQAAIATEAMTVVARRLNGFRLFGIGHLPLEMQR